MKIDSLTRLYNFDGAATTAEAEAWADRMLRENPPWPQPKRNRRKVCLRFLTR